MGISPQQFERMRQRASGRAGKAAVSERSITAQAKPPSGVLLGIDPSLRGTGFGVIEIVKPSPIARAHGTIACSAAWERSRCLAHIARSLRDAIREHKPETCVVEGLFYAQNLKTALIMGEARGAALAAVAEAGLEIYEIAPRKVKQAVVGYGGAQKDAVARMVQRMLNLEEPPAPDAADALAVALAHAQENTRNPLNSLKKI